MLSHLGYLFCLIGLVILGHVSFTHKTGSERNLGAACGNDTSHGDPILNPIDENPPTLVRKVGNGSVYTIGANEDQLWLVHVWGNSGYGYGYASGTLLKEQIIAIQGLAFASDSQNTLVEIYVDKEIYEEIRGIADASNVDYRAIRPLRMLGEMTRGMHDQIPHV